MTRADAVGESVAAMLSEADALNQRALLLTMKARKLRTAARALLAQPKTKRRPVQVFT